MPNLAESANIEVPSLPCSSVNFKLVAKSVTSLDVSVNPDFNPVILAAVSVSSLFAFSNAGFILSNAAIKSDPVNVPRALKIDFSLPRSSVGIIFFIAVLKASFAPPSSISFKAPTTVPDKERAKSSLVPWPISPKLLSKKVSKAPCILVNLSKSFTFFAAALLRS